MKIPFKETVMTVICVAILGTLGTWQVQRMHWKNGIIERLNAEYANKQNILSEAALAQLALEDAPMAYGAVDARLLREQSILLGPRTRDGRVGYHLLVPAALENGHTIIVNTGWVSDLWQDNIEDRLALLPSGPVLLRGVVHRPDWSSMASKNSPENNLWFRADIEEIAAVKELKNPYPFVLYTDYAAPELHDVKPHGELWLPRNKHLQYALFWYALGIVMLGIYGVYVAGLNRSGARDDG